MARLARGSESSPNWRGCHFSFVPGNDFEAVLRMRRWFLGYHSPDQALAERLKAAIERRDPASQVFFAPTNLRAGSFWTAQLAQELAEATAFILLVGDRGVGARQLPEYYEALDRRVKSAEFPVVFMLLNG